MNPPSPVMPSDSVVLNCNIEIPLDLTKPKVYWINPQEKTEHSDQGKLGFTAKSHAGGPWTCVVSDKKLFKFPITVSVAGESLRVDKCLLISYKCVFLLKVKVYSLSFRLLCCSSPSVYIH